LSRAPRVSIDEETRIVHAPFAASVLVHSTLVVLVAAFMGPGWRVAYETALHRGYRFLSFGDAMLAQRAS